MFILKVFILTNNQLVSAANAKDFNTDYYCSDMISGDLISHRNRSKLVKGSLFAINDIICHLLLEVKCITCT